ncbi:hypothetical protein BCR34DRAFT_239205 [Clohesyomyces aquaticus]|uniref:Uncharacterized protein n=1 Tax=Clohesyomyces aquaticus TaxID=1231657 RepID=A0A1Y1ZVS8_9PLEO|nr:hypothetical protein BCR34DRAFT_239205 [Clohesyomyces aquaticus]
MPNPISVIDSNTISDVPPLSPAESEIGIPKEATDIPITAASSSTRTQTAFQYSSVASSAIQTSQTLSSRLPIESTKAISNPAVSSPAALSDKGSLAPGAIAGIVISAIIGILLISGLAFFLGRRGQRKRRQDYIKRESGAEWHKPELDGNPVSRWASKARSRAVPVTDEVHELPGNMVERPTAHDSSGYTSPQPPPLVHVRHETYIAPQVPDDRENMETQDLGRGEGPALQQVNSALEDPTLTHNPWTQDDDERNGRDNTRRWDERG